MFPFFRQCCNVAMISILRLCLSSIDVVKNKESFINTLTYVLAGKKDDLKSLELSVGFPLFVTISGKICTCDNPDKHTELSKFIR